MPTYLSIDVSRSRVVSTISGAVGWKDMYGALEEIANHPDFKPEFDQLVDVTGVTTVDATYEDMRRVAELNPFAPSARRAIVGSSDFVYGMARMYETLTADRSLVRVFRTMPEAEEWLSNGRDPRSGTDPRTG
jgi:hypothetical protein